MGIEVPRKQYPVARSAAAPAESVPKRIEFVPGELAIRIHENEVGFVQAALKAWGKDYGHAHADEAIVLMGDHGEADPVSPFAYVLAHAAVEEALRYQYAIGDRTIASTLLAQFRQAEAAHDAHAERLHTSDNPLSLIPDATIHAPIANMPQA